MPGLYPEFRLAFRRLRASPAFTAFAIVTLALGIGTTTAIYAIIRAALAPPRGVTTIDRLVTINHSNGGSVPTIALSYGDFLDLRTRQQVFQDVAGWSFTRVSYAAESGTGAAWGELVTGEYFQVLGVSAARGRLLQPADDEPSAALVAVISHGVWQRVYGGAPDVIGRVMNVNGAAVEIAGVAPPTFAGLFNNGLIPTAIWLPLRTAETLSANRDRLDPSERSSRWVQVRARLKPGVTLEAAQADVTRIAAQLDVSVPIREDNPQFRSRYMISRPWLVRWTADIPLNEGADAFVKPLAAAVMGAVALVLLVACTNLTNLTLARGAARRQECAVRLALGASRSRLIRAELVESTVLAIAGGASGLLVARVLLALLGTELTVPGGAALQLEPRVDAAVLAVSVGATLLALVVAGLLPAWQTTRGDVRSALAADAGGALPRWRGRRMLIAAQVVVSVVLVAVAGLCVDQVRSIARLDPGFDLDHTALAEVNFTTQQIAEPQARATVAAVLDRLSKRPDVTAAGVSSGLPVGLYSPQCYIGLGDRQTTRAEFLASTPAFLEALGVRIMRGRALTAQDTRASLPVAVVSEFAAKALFDSADVVGRTFTVKRTRWAGEPEHPPVTRTIVGVAADTDTGSVGAGRGAAVYLPFEQQYEGRLVIVARATGDPGPVVGAIRQAISAADPGLAVVQSGTGPALAGPSNMFLQVTAGLTGALGMFALVLALIGLYGALSHVVLRRRREIGVRMALGATRPDVVRLVLRDGLKPVVLGVVVGLAVGAVARMAVSPMFERLMPALDPFVLIVVPVSMLLAGAAACLIPARRASRVDPNVALRDL
jgi:predicted permease